MNLFFSSLISCRFVYNIWRSGKLVIIVLCLCRLIGVAACCLPDETANPPKLRRPQKIRFPGTM